VGHGLAKVAALLWRLLLENLYIVTLAVVYLCSLQNVNVINAIFRTRLACPRSLPERTCTGHAAPDASRASLGTIVLFFIAFLLSRRVAERLWLVLVVYTELTLLAQFLWQFPFTAGVATDNAIALIFGMSIDLWARPSVHADRAARSQAWKTMAATCGAGSPSTWPSWLPAGCSW
jgi:hypothetical protein